MSNPELFEHQRTLYESRNPTRQWLHRRRRDWIVGAIHRYAPQKPGRALEVGPGSGVYLPVLAKLFREATAMDIERSYLQHLEPMTRRWNNLELVADNICHSRLPSASFDLILCSEVIEHIPDHRSALAEMHRILKPGGILILSTPQRYSPLELTAHIAFLPKIIDIIRRVYRESIMETGHINLMTAGQVAAELETAQFSIVERFASGVYLPFIAEFLGQQGLNFEQWLEPRLRQGIFSGALWTQYYVARVPGSPEETATC